MKTRKKKKKILVAVKPPTLEAEKLYKGIIRSIDVDDESQSCDIGIENLDPIQAGRIHVVRLPAALFPGSKTARFLAAAGQDIHTVGKRIVLGDIVGMRFSSSDGSDKDIEFERIEPAVKDKAEDSIVDDGPETLL
ncbi:MAG: hypothetical protein P8Z79_00685 [Sedimentisphaerales bacterium]